MDDMEIYVASLDGTLPVPESSCTRLTVNGRTEVSPHWTPDSSRLSGYGMEEAVYVRCVGRMRMVQAPNSLLQR